MELSMDSGTAQDLLERMWLVRLFEDRVFDLFTKGEIVGVACLAAGEEAVSCGVAVHLTPSDVITSTHRPHGHAIAHGLDVRNLMAELYGRSTGCCSGKGGSMHIADMRKGIMGGNGIVGGGAPLACGAALKAKLDGRGAVVICFFGDGATAQGTIHESMNLAAVWKLPIVFVCENDGFAQSTPAKYHSPIEDLADRAQGYAMPGVVVDGLDAVAVYEAAASAISRAREDQGPTFIEAKTWRNYGHFVGDPARYRSAEEEERARERDALDRFIRYLLKSGVFDEASIDMARTKAEHEVAQAVAYAESSPFPDVHELHTDVYATY